MKQGGGRTSKAEQVANLEQKLVRNHAVVVFFAASGIAMMVAEVRSTRPSAWLCALGWVGAGAGAVWGGVGGGHSLIRPFSVSHSLSLPGLAFGFGLYLSVTSLFGRSFC